MFQSLGVHIFTHNNSFTYKIYSNYKNNWHMNLLSFVKIETYPHHHIPTLATILGSKFCYLERDQNKSYDTHSYEALMCN